MEHKNNVKINWKTGLTSLVETFWAIGTSIAAAGVLQPHLKHIVWSHKLTHNQNQSKSLPTRTHSKQK